jgi:hypothetical protein
MQPPNADGPDFVWQASLREAVRMASPGLMNARKEVGRFAEWQPIEQRTDRQLE